MNNRKDLQNKLLKNRMDEMIKFFQKYRKFSNSITEFRKTFYGILKREILLSLNIEEKVDLCQQLGNDIYSPPQDIFTYNIYENPYCNSFSNEIYTNLTNSSNMCNVQIVNNERNICIDPNERNLDNESLANNIDFNSSTSTFNSPKTYNDIENSSSHNQSIINIDNNNIDITNSQTDFDEEFDQFISDYYCVTSRSCINRESITIDNEDDWFSSSDIDDVDIKSFQQLNLNRNDEQYLIIVDQYKKLSDMIKNNEGIIEELDNIKTKNGDEIYKKTIEYIPINSNMLNEPIIFQLAIKFDLYQSTLDKLFEDQLLTTNQKNQLGMSIFNVLLFKNISNLGKFLMYIKEKNIEHNIKYIFCKSDCLLNNRTITPGEQLLVNKGILYCRNLLLENNSKIIKELKELDMLEYILNVKIPNETTLLKYLADEYPKSQEIILSIDKENNYIISQSSFIVILAKRSINLYYEFLIMTINIKEKKVEKKILCNSYNTEFEGSTIISLIEENENVEENQKAIKNIKEFYNKYK